MKILLRSHKSPFEAAGAEDTLARNLIGNNVGNLVFAQAAHRILATSNSSVATSDLRPSSIDAATINERYDHLVIPLANAFRPAFLDNLEHLSTLIERLRIPVVVLGVGAQASIDGTVPKSDLVDAATRRFLRAVLDRSPSIGVRGEFTAEYLASLGFGDEHVDVIGCPSMYRSGPEFVLREPGELSAESKISITISPYVKQMAPIVKTHTRRYPRMIYVAQDHHTLELMVWGEYRGRGRSKELPIHVDHPLYTEDRIRFFLDPQTWFNHLRDFEFSFGTRIHGTIAALLAGTPSVLLSHDSRTAELAEFHQIPHQGIHEVKRDVDARDLMAAADWGPMVKAQPGNFDTFAKFLARHGLRHAFEPGETTDAFDERLAATNLPDPVRTLAAPAEQYARLRWIRDRDATRRGRGWKEAVPNLRVGAEKTAKMLGRLTGR